LIVIFDVDGVLLDVSKSYHYSIKDTVEHFSGKNIDLELLRDIKFSFSINNDWDASVAGILFAKSGKDIEQFKNIFKDFSQKIEDMYEFAKKYEIDLPLYKELVDFFEEQYRIHREKEEMIFPYEILEEIKNRSKLTGVITGRPFEDLDFSFKKFGLYEYFDHIITESDIPSPDLRKPSSYPLEMFFEKYEYEEPVYYIGDTLSDKKMVENFNQKRDKNVTFVLNETPHNKDIQSELRLQKPEQFLELIKEVKK